MAVAALAVLLFFYFSPVRSAAERATVGQERMHSRAAQNFALAKWIERNLEPSDGAVGVYWAGVSYHLPDFEVADFLGKGDEAIASLEPKVGPPGHNKWDFAVTIDKWNPQVVIPIDRTDPSRLDYYLAAQSLVANPATSWVVHHEMNLSPDIRTRFQWCEVLDVPDGSGEPLGLLLRNDVAGLDSLAGRCTPLWPPPA